MRGAIILAGGSSTRLGRRKAFIPVAGVPLLSRVVRAARQVADDIVVVTKHSDIVDIEKLLGQDSRVVEDNQATQSPLVGFISGADALPTQYTAFLACDLPFLSPDVLNLLFEASFGVEAVIPRWPDDRIEPMVAVYHRERAFVAATTALKAGELANTDMIRRLRRIRYMNVEGLRSVDPDLTSFLNVNSPKDLAAAESQAKRTRMSSA